ncbi:MAG TPA: hypothetical protein VK007_11555 [Acidimicrobiales bacterium]|nr:hypothetical protein [Acidimicrobiales bacterium]
MLLRALELLAARRRRPGASGIWTGVAFAAFLLRRYQARQRQDEVVLREELRPGEALLITHTDQPHG